MQIRYTPPEDLEVSASEHELRRISHALTAGLSREFLGEESFDPAPYEKVLTTLEITPGNGPAEVSVTEQRVVLRGGPEHLERLATFFASAAQGGHAHFEWFEGNSFVHRNSVPLVIAAVSGG